MGEILASKSADYSIDGEFSAFEYAAEVVGIEVQDVMLAQIGIKLARLKSLIKSNSEPLNEPIYDTIQDLHGYAAILHGYTLYLEANK